MDDSHLYHIMSQQFIDVHISSFEERVTVRLSYFLTQYKKLRQIQTSPYQNQTIRTQRLKQLGHSSG